MRKSDRSGTSSTNQTVKTTMTVRHWRTKPRYACVATLLGSPSIICNLGGARRPATNAALPRPMGQPMLLTGPLLPLQHSGAPSTRQRARLPAAPWRSSWSPKWHDTGAPSLRRPGCPSVTGPLEQPRSCQHRQLCCQVRWQLRYGGKRAGSVHRMHSWVGALLTRRGGRPAHRLGRTTAHPNAIGMGFGWGLGWEWMGP